MSIQHPVISDIERTGWPLGRGPGPEPAIACSSCGAEIALEQSAYGLCETCEAAAWERFRAFILDLSPQEREYIDARIEGHSLTEIDKIPPHPAIY